MATLYNSGNKNHRMRISLRPRPRLRQKRKLVVAGSFSLLGITGMLIYFQFSKPGYAHAAVSGDFQAVSNGNWSSTGTWQKYNGTAWVAAVATPTSADGVIEIPSGVTVILTANVTADQIIVDAGGAVIINSSRYLYTAAGTGTDLTVNGTLTIN